MKIVALTPAHVGAEETGRRQARYDQFADGRFEVLVVDQPDRPDVPHSFDTPELIASSQPRVVEQAEAWTFADDEVVMPDCILDTSLESLEEGTTPAYGILRLNVRAFQGLGLKYGAVARNTAVGNALDARIRGYDASDSYCGTAILDLPTEAVKDTERWNAALAEHVQKLADAGAEVVINGCSAVDVADERWAIPVVDPTRLAIDLIATSAANGVLGRSAG